MEEIRSCLVCCSPVTASHFGVDACRACAAFFKRARISGKSFRCNRGNFQCTVSSDGRFFCRRCRFDKCCRVGMNYTARGTEVEEITEIPTQPSSSTVSLLPNFGREYEVSFDRRRNREQVILENCEKSRVPHASEELYTTSYDNVISMFDLTLEETRRFLIRAFPSISSFSKEEQEDLLLKFLPIFHMIEAHYRTWKIWGDVYRYMIASTLLCTDLSKPDSWIAEEYRGTERESLKQSIGQLGRDQRSILMPALQKAELSNTEFHAVLALALCDSGDDLSPSIGFRLTSIRQTIIADLKEYYKTELGLSNYAVKLGQLLSVRYCVQECSSIFRTTILSQHVLYDLLKTQEKLKELLV